MGKTRLQSSPASEAGEADGNEAAEKFGGIGAESANPLADGDAEESVGDGGESAEKTLGIAHVLVEMSPDELAVEPGSEIAVGIEEGDVDGGDSEAGDGDKAHENPITEEKRGNDSPTGTHARPEIEERSGKITESDALQYSGNAPSGKVVVRKCH